MGYINKITIGGEEYSLAPEVASSGLCAIDDSGNILKPRYLTVNTEGQIGLNLAAPLGGRIYTLIDMNGNYCCGLGIDVEGSFGLALYRDGRVTLDSNIAPLAIYQGRIGVYACNESSKFDNILRTTIAGALYAGVDWVTPPAAIIGDSGSKIAEINLGVSNYGLYLYTTQIS